MKKILFLFCIYSFLAFTCYAESENYFKSLFLKVPYKSAIYTQINTVYIDKSETPIVSTSKVWFKEGKIRTETLDEKGQVVGLGIVRDGYAYSQMDIKSKEGFKTEIDPKNNALSMLIDTDDSKNAKKTGEETVNGVNCGVYKYDQHLKVMFIETKYEITEYRNSDGFVMKTFTNTQDSEKPSTVEVVKLERNPFVSDTKFEIPKDVTYTDLVKDLGLSGLQAVKRDGNQAKTDSVEKTQENEQPTKTAETNSDDNGAAKVAGEAAGALLKGFLGQ